MTTCRLCGSDLADRPIPPPPPIGRWVKDRYGAAHIRTPDGNWASAPSREGFGKWEAMWEARGPLTECGPWGREINT